MTIDEPLFPVVGIGASAGGVQAIETFFGALQSDPGLAFVIITHLSPDRDSLLHEIIARCTAMPVFVAEDGMTVLPNCVYVMPPNAIMTFEAGHLRIRKPNQDRRERNPIDLFLSSLAVERGDYAAAIILSGGGADGSLGVKAIREHGGLTFAQTADGTKPAHADMPASAIATGLVDHALPVQDMPAELAAFRQSLQIDLKLDATDDAADEPAKEQQRAYDALRKQTGHDFSGYKVKTFMRRVQRRMNILQFQTFGAYVTRLEEDHHEITQLFRDLLINVTDFFRDAEAFEALETSIIPALFEGRSADDTVRVWVPGCATGEEVFSIGILLREYMDTLKAVPRVQIFATDIDDTVLLVARAARYPEALLEGLSPERRRRFFLEDGGTYLVSKEVRDLCIFSPHSVIRDPPFSRIDLVSCRNLLIYFGAEIQNQVIPIFHYALRPGGYLFLGSSENIGDFSDLFAAVDKKHRIFQMRDHGSIKRLPAALYGTRTKLAPSNGSSPSSIPLRHSVEARIIDRFAPAHVVVNGDGDIVYCSQHTGKYLEVAHGPPSRQLLAMARRGLRLDLRSALQEATDTRKTAVRNNLVIDDDPDDVQMVRLTVDPIRERDSTDNLILVLFEDIGAPPWQFGTRPQDRDASDAVKTLERDLRDTRERLQSMIEEYETAIEELKSSNEELVSVNEELQSTNEEMEASKEELQSLNEELQTVNMELTAKLDDLDRVNGDLKNLFESTQIATVFLDRDLVIRSFTPAISRIFRLIPNDRGRPLTDFAIDPAYPELQEHVRQVFETGEPFEHRIAEPTHQARYLVRLIPYRDKNEHVEGVVVTFVDITSLTALENEQEILTKELNHRAKNAFAVTTSLIRHTVAADTESFRTSAIARLQSLAEAYDLVRRDRPPMPLDAILAQWLSPFGADRFTATGPVVMLTPLAGRSVGRIVQELTTNAAKYGALSEATGRVDVTWTLADDRLEFRWEESGGPAAADDYKSGYGLTLIESEAKIGLGGESTIDFREAGLAFGLSFTP